MAPIVLTSVSKTYRGHEAVRDVSFTVPDRSICVLTGPTGAGKSTLLRLIASREAPTSGTVEIGDAVSQSWRLGRPEVATLVDVRDLDPGKHLYANMAKGFAGRGLKRSEVETRTLGAADAMALGPLMARKASDISSGEAARAAFGRAFCPGVRAILLDEPFAALDPARRIALRRELRRLTRDEDVSIVVATHDVGDALALADVLMVLEDGRLVAAGAPDELYGRPATVTLARLLGAPPMNILPVRGNQTGLSLEDGTHFGATSVMTTSTFAQLGVRPEDLFVVRDGAPPAAAIFPVVVDEIERMGHETMAHGHVGPFSLVARLTGPVEPPASGPLKLGARRESLHMFDAETGARI